jgi:hypothetical protein
MGSGWTLGRPEGEEAGEGEKPELRAGVESGVFAGASACSKSLN